jgi:hypothetical protein
MAQSIATDRNITRGSKKKCPGNACREPRIGINPQADPLGADFPVRPGAVSGGLESRLGVRLPRPGDARPPQVAREARVQRALD